MTTVYCIMGPTGAGKTGLAMALAERYPLEIISVDSAQVYRYLNIGTAKPTVREQRAVPHRLINLCDPDEQYSAAQFREDALREIDAVRRRGNLPLLVGGTGLYFRVLLEGIAELPSSSPEVRGELEAQANERGLKFMHRKLTQVDPVAAKRIHPNDPQRILRALEVHTMTGQSMTSLLATKQRPGLPYPVKKIGLLPSDRRWLSDRLERRFSAMLRDGLINEVRALFHRGRARRGDPALKLVGYREVTMYLDGAYDHDTLRRMGTIATRQLAKRQMTWLRREKDLTVIDPRWSGITNQAIAAWQFDDKSGT